MPEQINDQFIHALDTEATSAQGDPFAIPTGLRDLDALTAGGLHPGTLTVIASRPGMGRSTLMADICRHNAVGGDWPVAIWTVEETGPEFATRLLSAEARVSRNYLRAGTCDQDARTRIAKTVSRIENAPLYLGTPASLTTAQLVEEASELVASKNVRLIAVDGIQDIRPERRSDLREREVGDVVRDLKTLARQLGVPVVATSHLNRGPEQRTDKRPRLDDLRESGAITFAADLLVLLHREDYYEPQTPRAGEADLIVAKHRHGSTATVTVGFMGHYGRFVDIALDDRPTLRPAGPGFAFSDISRSGSDEKP